MSPTGGRRLLLGAILLLLACFPACGNGQPATATPTSSSEAASEASAATTSTVSAALQAPAPLGDVITIGVALSLTGQLAREGRITRDGFDFWQEAVNRRGGISVAGKSVRLAIKYYDDESNSQTSARLTEKLITQDNVRLLFGPYGSPATFAASAVSEKYQVPMINESGASPSISNRGFRYVFSPIASASSYASVMLEVALVQSPKPKSVAVLSSNDVFSLDVARAAEEFARSRGLDVVYSDRYPARARDLSALLAAAKTKSPEIVLGSGHLDDSLLVVKQSREQALNARLFGFTVGPSSPEFREVLKKDADYVVGSTQWSPSMKYRDVVFGSAGEYAAAFRGRFGYDPEFTSAAASAAGLVMQKAIENGASVDPIKVRDALTKLEMDTFFGPVKFDDRGQNMAKSMAVEQWQNGKRVLVWPKDLAEAELLYPAPAWEKR